MRMGANWEINLYETNYKYARGQGATIQIGTFLTGGSGKDL